ncbi:hypothetical protein IEO21_00218 [Rhodonia placenta]|uniref:Protein kinase domain-containing protein n=1 Tax=Rhodonia placenta TaxID=104341 RepID=A0A8H7U6K8_9APHY|nr:hypothetical protein IEO21_00218 [Postia placenta]
MNMYESPRGAESDEEKDSSGDEDILWVTIGRRLRGGPARTWTIPPKPPSRSRRSYSAPPTFSSATKAARSVDANATFHHHHDMLATTATIDLAFDDDDWIAPPPDQKLFRAASVGNSWGVTSIGRGFDWHKQDEDTKAAPADQDLRLHPELPAPSRDATATLKPRLPRVNTHAATKNLLVGPSTGLVTSPVLHSVSPGYGSFIPGPLTRSPPLSRPASPYIAARTTSPRPLSPSSSTDPPTPNPEVETLNERSISEFVIEREIGRGAYGLVKRAREMNSDGTLGQIIKSRILADCWKRHPKYGTIPIEIYVMSAISSTQYVLPSRRPWDPSRSNPEVDDFWQEGKVVNGHPNICPLLDFFEDNHYYYLVLPSTTPEPKDGEPPPPSDLFDLVESYPHGLPPSSIRSYLGQIADAMSFLHSKGIVHRDIKDENVVLGPAGKCVLIDFGSSGLVKKGGWDTFSGTLDYAGPEILRGERYFGKEQDVWAFGVVAYVMVVGECPFTTAAEAQEGLESPFSNAAIALDERCADDKELEGEESDGGGALGDAAALVRACLQVDVGARPTFQTILQSRFLSGRGGWGMKP